MSLRYASVDGSVRIVVSAVTVNGPWTWTPSAVLVASTATHTLAVMTFSPASSRPDAKPKRGRLDGSVTWIGAPVRRIDWPGSTCVPVGAG